VRVVEFLQAWCVLNGLIIARHVLIRSTLPRFDVYPLARMLDSVCAFSFSGLVAKAGDAPINQAEPGVVRTAP
jgi:hypothetical protein